MKRRRAIWKFNDLPSVPGYFLELQTRFKVYLQESGLPRPWGFLTVASNASPRLGEAPGWSEYRAPLRQATEMGPTMFLSVPWWFKENLPKKSSSALKKWGKLSWPGGPLFTTEPEQFTEVDHLVLNEAEITLAPFLKDPGRGKRPGILFYLWTPSDHPNPPPMWSLSIWINTPLWACNISRGCPFNCEFCDITFLDGRVPRTKSASADHPGIGFDLS